MVGFINSHCKVNIKIKKETRLTTGLLCCFCCQSATGADDGLTFITLLFFPFVWVSLSCRSAYGGPDGLILFMI